ncbi:hypothetical protein M406DRAFT_327792 [Cryphonectria parasitica EP155]|uniref:SnoaL-like domain-containing protein n=1 Tax=Cryphonectria parasitica (strain ATCC 38755 / EP155) TaxID=660469 RepID=A0A9P4Y559_CRYP1|nr:uncharacterized protein M406DRAFT_327792 [Cryphonectria parasitica EP155]KAF3766664.1 hypothetical protein M406DRAFT_327792 [Cryphonectria parasitica EP155]
MYLPSTATLLSVALLLALPTSAAPSAKRVRQLFEVLTTGNFTDFFDLFSPNSTWNTIGFGVRDYDEMVEVFSEINCLLSNPPLIIETDLVLSQGSAGPYTSVQAHVPNGYIGTNVSFKGVQYNQTYSWIMKWDGETILSNTEYINDILAEDLIGDNSGNC